MNKFLSKKITNNLREKKNKLRKIAIMLIATITFTTLGTNFVQAKESGIYNRDVICANTDPSVVDAVQHHRDIYKSTKLDSFVVEENAFTYATLLGKHGAVFLEGTSHIGENGNCKDGCKAVIATAGYRRGTKPGTEEANYCIGMGFFCLNCSRNKGDQLPLESYTNPSERARLSNNSPELKGLFDGMDRYFAEHPEESPVPITKVSQDVINKIKSNRKFVLENGIYVKENGENVTAKASVEDVINVDGNGICKGGNHRRTYAHYTHKGADFLTRSGCFDCLQESYKVIEKTEYDDLEERIKLASTSERAKAFFVENGLSFEIQNDKIDRVNFPKTLIDSKHIKLSKTRWYQLNCYSNDIVEVVTEKSNVPIVFVMDINTGNMEIKILSGKLHIYNVKIIDVQNIKLTNIEDGTEQIINKKNLGSFQADPLTLTLITKDVILPALCITVFFLRDSLKELSTLITQFIESSAKAITKALEGAIAIPLIQTISNAKSLELEIGDAITQTKKKKASQEKKIYVEVIVGKDNRVHVANNIILSKNEAVRKIKEGKNIFTPLKDDAHELFVESSYGYNPIEDIKIKKDKNYLPDHPHYYGKVDRNKLNDFTDKKKKYKEYEKIDKDFEDANNNGYFAHYHPLGYGHQGNIGGPGNPHIMYLGDGGVDDIVKRLIDSKKDK